MQLLMKSSGFTTKMDILSLLSMLTESSSLSFSPLKIISLLN